MAFPWAAALNLAGSAVLIAFGLFVWRVEPAKAQNRAFALFAVGFSAGTALSNLLNPAVGLFEGTVADAGHVARGLLYAAGGVGAAWFAQATVRPTRRHVRWAAAGPVLLIASTGWVVQTGRFAEPGVASVPLQAVNTLGFAVLLAGFLYALAIFALDFGRPGRDRARRREWAFMSAALVLYPGFYLVVVGLLAAYGSPDAPTASMPLANWTMSAVYLGALFAVSTAWIRNTRVAGSSAVARNLALLTLGMGLLGVVLWSRCGEDAAGLCGAPFASRTATVAILAYAVLKHQVLGIEAKVRWGISKTTVAGAFIAVFFVVSEGAQLVFGGDNPWLGLLAAAALVFAISPLQRAADRIAARAVPVSAPGAGAEGAAEADEALYVAQLRLALRDREVTPDEEVTLAALADKLGIGAKRAVELRHQVQAEMADGTAEPRTT